ncbi:hypothetical protein BZA05DRAFT_441855 [Tricharina praecox]|uniref:uncharacterized protein n=1 Tax=Tricharina praecox TaxID=43433 RepID=UPI0022200F24|nr:uncharacterized protein BZA05DRAFT_441855 [Tricharina praecox]KAI5857225.1 hypothetical protein BZA05DRAFT_441855 [Tricharina praecox]
MSNTEIYNFNYDTWGPMKIRRKIRRPTRRKDPAKGQESEPEGDQESEPEKGLGETPGGRPEKASGEDQEDDPEKDQGLQPWSLDGLPLPRLKVETHKKPCKEMHLKERMRYTRWQLDTGLARSSLQQSMRLTRLHLHRNPKIGNRKRQNPKIGNCKIGSCKIGSCKIGSCKIGNCKIGNCKIGNCKIGNPKSRNLKIGNYRNPDRLCRCRGIQGRMYRYCEVQDCMCQHRKKQDRLCRYLKGCNEYTFTPVTDTNGMKTSYSRLQKGIQR